MRKRCRRTIRREAAPTVVAYYLNPEVSIQERMAVVAIRAGAAEVCHFDVLADCRDMLTLAACEKNDAQTLAVCEIGLVALENIKARYFERQRIGATGDEIQALQALVDVSEDFWKRQGGALFISAEAALSKARDEFRQTQRSNRRRNTMKQPTIGASLEGGTFGGVINVNGQHKGVIWSPKHAGQIRTTLLPARKIAKGDYSPSDCAANMRALLASGSPAAQQIEAMEINGYKDWVIPSRDVLELGYRHFKPTNRQNYCSWRDGENPNSVPPGWLYTENMPAQTSIEAFQDNGEDAFDEAWYWSSTVLPDGKKAFVQSFDDGTQNYYDLSYEVRVRAVRLIQLGS